MSYRDLVASMTPAAYWPMSDAAGATTIQDVSGNGKNLSNSGGCTPGAASVLPGGLETSASSFTATLCSRQGPDGSYWAVGTGDFAMSAWVIGLDTSRINQCVFAMDDGNGNGFILYHEATAGTAPRMWLAASATNFSGAVISDSQRHHAMINRVGNQVSCYVDGVASSTVATNGGSLNPTTSAYFVTVGNVVTGTLANAVTGRLAHVAYWKRSLTASERSLLYQGGLREGVVVG